ncbi:hypothetical protein ACFC18_26455 [Streptomyces sp. NPDC056121]|jgi:hypothetical protein|uniref:hypothetical protein n=1 Tax=Streptomyces TaxID=1883 RepID=UPI001D0A5FF4|nr:hypothetical protein [Streptomyces longhuiensis]UDM04717.1 hypothetical protein LGI35_44050 [Streptomyces longhuiensis]
MTEVSTRSVRDAAVATHLRRTTTLDVPEEFETWSVADLADWLHDTEDDPQVSDEDFYQARKAVQMLGVEDV